jgi:hypothetical protein
MVSKRRRMRVNANMIKRHGGGTCRSLEESREDMIELSGQRPLLDFHPILVLFFLSGDAFLSQLLRSLSLAEKSRRRVTRFRFSIIRSEGLRRSRRCRNSECNLPRSSAKRSSLSSRRL